MESRYYPRASTAGVTDVTSTTTNTTLLYTNLSRLGATIFNDSTKILYVKLGRVASATDFTVKLLTGAYYEVPFGYIGQIDGIWSAANGFARVTELTI